MTRTRTQMHMAASHNDAHVLQPTAVVVGSSSAIGTARRRVRAPPRPAARAARRAIAMLERGLIRRGVAMRMAGLRGAVNRIMDGKGKSKGARGGVGKGSPGPPPPPPPHTTTASACGGEVDAAAEMAAVRAALS
eukprot:SAG31_NODE_467_length_15267_cov_13.792919_1_plen_134_part_10